MIEFKYLKKDEANKLEEKQKEAREQINRYCEYEEIHAVDNLKKYSIVVVVDSIYSEIIGE